MLSNEELLKVRGGGFSVTLLNSISRLINTLFELGQNIGSSLRRAVAKKTCKLS